jgi:hypothetical protein
VIKLLYLILFYLVFRITDLILLAVMLIQMVLTLVSGEPSNSVKVFGKSLGIYLQQISEFLSYASEEKPFPFSDWPEVRSTSEKNTEVNGTHDSNSSAVVTDIKK